MNDAGSAPVAFIVGTGRCGSTLLHELVARNPDVAFVSNVDDHLRSTRLSHWNNHLFRQVPPAVTVKGRPRFAPSEGYRILARSVSPLLRDTCRDLTGRDATPWLRERTRRFFADAAARQGKPVFLHKFTGWPRARFLAAALPEARFVHVVRDGRAVANSLLQTHWWRGYEGPETWGLGPLPGHLREDWDASGRSFVVLAGLAWKLLTGSYIEARRTIEQDRWCEVRYEDLVAAPHETVSQVEAFLGLASTDLAARVAAHSIRSQRAAAYLRDLGGEDVAALDRVLGDQLAVFGYGAGPR